MRVHFFIAVFLSAPFFCNAQGKGITDGVSYPQDYFRNPLDIPIFLAGNFGECRPGHFHSGVDIKTLGKEGQPVHAAADGYISRIKMEKGGFGHGIYITHPNGYTTLYAHLSNFEPAIQNYVKKEQYKQKHWDVDLQLSPDQFPVKKGQQIAWSGNTGASTAPHLHFEIRNTKTEHPLNPELFGLPIVDNIAPVPTDLAIYELNNSIYEQTPYIVAIKKIAGKYVFDSLDENEGNVEQEKYINGDTIHTEASILGVGLVVNDFMNGSDNTLAFLTAQLFMDDNLQCEIRLDDIGYDETRYINAYADYTAKYLNPYAVKIDPKSKENYKKWVQCFFKLPGNHLDSIYRFLNSDRGALILPNHNTHRIKIIVTDDRNNSTNLLFYVKLDTIDDNQTSPLAGIDHIETINFYANKENNFKNPNVLFSLDSKQLYDDVDFIFIKTPDPDGYSDQYRLHYASVPIHHYFELQIKPNKPIPFNLRGKVAMMYTDDKDIDGRAASLEDNGWYKAKVRNFGTYWLDIDTTAPQIVSMQKNGANLARAKQIAFDATDDKTSIKNFNGYLDGKWICFEQHGDSFFYKFDEHCPKGKHKLVFKAEDENENIAIYNLTFTR